MRVTPSHALCIYVLDACDCRAAVYITDLLVGNNDRVQILADA